MAVAGDFIEQLKKIFGDQGPRVILDVGSRDLEESIQMSEAFPNTRIIAFEPNPNQFPICVAAGQNYPNIEVYEYACNDQEDVVDFWIVNENVGASSILEPEEDFLDAGWQNGYRPCTFQKLSGIRARRIDTVLTEIGVDKVDAVWMDVQGNELKALQGMGKFIDDVKLMHTEAALKPYYKGHAPKSDLELWIHQQGFETEFLKTRDPHPFGESDLVCIRK